MCTFPPFPHIGLLKSRISALTGRKGDARGRHEAGAVHRRHQHSCLMELLPKDPPRIARPASNRQALIGLRPYRKAHRGEIGIGKCRCIELSLDSQNPRTDVFACGLATEAIRRLVELGLRRRNEPLAPYREKRFRRKAHARIHFARHRHGVFCGGPDP
jgi:hypothetical protein